LDDWSIGTGASARAITLSIIRGTIKETYVDGGKIDFIMMPPDIKVDFSLAALGTGSGAVQIRSNVPTNRAAAVVGSVETFLSDFGTHDIVVNVQQASDANFLNKTVYYIDKRYLGVAFYRDMRGERLAKTGDGEREHVLAEYTLVVGAPKANGIDVNIT